MPLTSLASNTASTSYSPVIASAAVTPGCDLILAATSSARPGDALISTYAFMGGPPTDPATQRRRWHQRNAAPPGWPHSLSVRLQRPEHDVLREVGAGDDRHDPLARGRPVMVEQGGHGGGARGLGEDVLPLEQQPDRAEQLGVLDAQHGVHVTHGQVERVAPGCARGQTV